ncbi:hypothetical protein DUNSADRAFT_5572 [Dunaliella salina]|uniref:Uncharacterized protein n=1 Tax=Dunaliella salina TaxID=3046 RepID=A0ABQ7GQ19_DUNSA|nr:hypothetical protein DUNSADRAFT_5572 [Dunaliella salina]|eukprot:KAF5836697.1 hypothetical protein DUNSADRAFT_5572 [Dunaliella salina]
MSTARGAKLKAEYNRVRTRWVLAGVSHSTHINGVCAAM